MKTFTVTALTLALLGAVASAQPAKRDFYGDATYYYQYGVAGSCGQYHADSDSIAALSPSQIGGNCGRTIRVSRDGHPDVYATVADTCPGCATGSIDLSTGAFDQIGAEAEGRIQVHWDFV
ncbi:hypothetical protein CF319_g218 [Tilletia indica]|uniref:RlpA-like protein double-psi beta-barrel domain-containing protein n=2 Tax=Tilletia TaxID=13289 RepID=A0A8X7T827_9BASI|nr:hypothetical protein CF327_g3386 [Tilletia walkeri]KAE8227275.1 hypothetical protein CF319_g218 [Tilletia indica]KAE8248784.1 hypothetical protein A4X13_0g5474 [Tilletia indica]KAE8271528.1 hypothetical protein A4X09_0g809 [Tilletia walkeri]